MKNYFNTWFSEQFGGLPLSPEQRTKLENHRAILMLDLGDVEDEIEKDYILRKQYEAARYAKNKYEK